MNGLKKFVAVLAVTTLSLLGVNAIAPASADPYQGAHISLVTPTITDDIISEKAKNQAMAETWVAAGWFGDGLTYTRTWAPIGSRIILTYHVADANGVPLVGETVVLRANKQYSDSRAQITVDGTSVKAATSAADGLKVPKVTDQYGNVSFTVINLNIDGEEQPPTWTSKPTIALDGTDDTHAQFLPQIAGEALDHSVITEFHFYNPSSEPAAQPKTAPTIRMSAPALTNTNSIHRADLETLFSVTNPWYAAGIGVRQVYAKVGTTTNVVYNVKDDNGKPLVGEVLKLHVGKAYSGSNAKVSDVTKSTTNAAANTAAADNADQALWTATTDAFGNAMFTIKNSDTTGEPIPATPTTATPVDKAAGAVFTQLWPEVAGLADVGDMVEFHYVSLPAVAVVMKTAASISGTAKVGKVLTVAKGSWTGTPAPTYAYKWYRCTLVSTKASTVAPAAAAKCSAIAKATAATYKLVAADKGKFVRAQVTAANSLGAKVSLTKTSAKVG
jgi:hypothetical protein